MPAKIKNTCILFDLSGQTLGPLQPMANLIHRIVLSVEDKLNYLEHPIPATLVPAHAGQQVTQEALAAHAAWVKGSKEIVGFMLMTMESEIQRNLENLGAYKMLYELKTLFAQQAEEELLQNVRDFHSCKQKEEQSVSSYILKVKSYIDNLERLGHPVSLNLGTVNELHAILKLHEQTLPKEDAPRLHVIQAGKVQKMNNKHKKPQLADRVKIKGKERISLLILSSPRFSLHQRRKILLRTQSVINAVIHVIGRGTVLSI
ncbi:hypothetical protein Tco_0286432 [Tanacetum coccineum]